MTNISNSDNTQIEHNNHSPNQEHIAADSSHTHNAEAHSAEAHHEGEGNIMITMLQEHLLDHHSYNFYNVFQIDFPVILYDDGFHLYSSMKAMEAEGTFTEVHHQIVRAENHLATKMDFSITSLVFFQWLSMLILFFMFFSSGRKYKKDPNKAPSGLQNMLEVLVLYVRDEIIRPNIPSVKLADQLSPYFLALFFFILAMNLIGLLPGGHTATGNLAVTAGLAITAYFVINGTAIWQNGFWGWIKEFTGGAPPFIWIIMIPIEILSMFTKPFALTVRLFANMTAGHAVILSLIGLIFLLQTLAVVPVVTAFTLFIYGLELLVAFIQAYVFTILTAVFVGLTLAHGEHSVEHH
jgi:F-type H+-transporting ATPase subunit a